MKVQLSINCALCFTILIEVEFKQSFIVGIKTILYKLVLYSKTINATNAFLLEIFLILDIY
jgi:hypothetical protein